MANNFYNSGGNQDEIPSNFFDIVNPHMMRLAYHIVDEQLSGWANYFSVVREELNKKIALFKEPVKEEDKRTSTRLRFKILERDKFTCQYCWIKSPDVVLHVDHKIPFSLGGKTVDENLITACAKCNLGKSNLFIT